MKPTANGHNYPEFSVKESRANLSSSILEIFKLEEWTHLVHKFRGFSRDPGPGLWTKAVYGTMVHKENTFIMQG